MDTLQKSGVAMLEVLESWGIDHIYGIPGGSFNSTMNALYEKRGTIRFIQVRHEETGAIAASAEAKLTGKIAVCSGTAGPGATHLFNGLYDAKMDSAPVLALVGQVSSAAMNYNSFQEMNENPMFADVSVYNRTVMTAESLPFVIDEAIRQAYEHKGVAVVTIPVDFGYVDIPQKDVSSAENHRKGYPEPDDQDIDQAIALIAESKRPVLYVGRGATGSGDTVVEFSEHFSMPIVLSVMAKGLVADNTENFMGTAGRLATKPANEILAAADLIVFAGSNFPFARFFFPPAARFIQIDIDSSRLGSRHKTDVAILGDAATVMRKMIGRTEKRETTPFLKAARINRVNWLNWLHGFDESDEIPLRLEPVFKEINRIANDNAIFICDVGNVTLYSVRMLEMNGREQMFTTSGLFATMGYGVPGGIGAKLSFPDRQVITISGDGGFAMVMQDIITQVKYGLQIINVVFSNESLGFINDEQEDTKQDRYGVSLLDTDFAKAAEAMGARGFTVTRREQLAEVFDQAEQSDRPVVIDIKISNERPLPAEALVLNTDKFGIEAVEKFKSRYKITGMPTLGELLDSV